MTIANAQVPSIPWVEVREEGVLSPGGSLESANFQHIDYREADRAECLVKIAQAVKRFRDLTNITMIRLGPTAAVEQIGPWLDDPSFSCTSQTLRGAVQLPVERRAAYPIKRRRFRPTARHRAGRSRSNRHFRQRTNLALELRIGGYCRCTGEGVAVALSIQQSEKYLGGGRWKWSVWLDGIPAELDSVDHVTYILHPTFHDPVRRIADRATNFRLDTSGWGTFTVYANVAHRDGSETALSHDLVLHYPDGKPTAA